METTLQMNRLVKFIVFNVLLLILLYSIPISSDFLSKLCIFKNILGKPCFNCGMTRAFLSILHFKYAEAYEFNHNVIIVFPMTVGVYLYSWYKYIIRGC